MARATARVARTIPLRPFYTSSCIVRATLAVLTRVGFLGGLLPLALAFAMCGFAPSPLDPLSFALFESLLFFDFGSGAGLARRGQGRGPGLRLQAALGQWLIPEHGCQQP